MAARLAWTEEVVQLLRAASAKRALIASEPCVVAVGRASEHSSAMDGLQVSCLTPREKRSSSTLVLFCSTSSASSPSLNLPQHPRARTGVRGPGHEHACIPGSNS